MFKISIIIPIYNVEPCVATCLNSVVTQSYRGPLECLLVDDCGTDQSMVVVEQLISDYQGTILFRVLHHSHNRGLSAARNTGMEAATGDYIFFLDSDDVIEKNCIEALVKPLEEEKYDVVVGNIQTIGDEKKNSFLRLKLNDGEILRGKEIEETYRNKWNMVAVNKLYRSAFIREQKLQFKEGLIHEDELWSLQIACLAKTLRAVGHFTYLYYVRGGSLTTADETKASSAKMIKIVVVEICKFLKERKIYSPAAFELMYQFFFFSLRPSLHDKVKYLQDYCELRKAVSFPMRYWIMVSGFHPKAQFHSLILLLPPMISSRFTYYWYANRLSVNKTVGNVQS